MVAFQIATSSLYHLIVSPALRVMFASKVTGSPVNDLSPPKSGFEQIIATTTSFEGVNDNQEKARVIASVALNSFNPVYRFSTDDIVADKGNLSVAKDAMKLINVQQAKISGL